MTVIPGVRFPFDISLEVGSVTRVHTPPVNPQSVVADAPLYALGQPLGAYR